MAYKDNSMDTKDTIMDIETTLTCSKCKETKSTNEFAKRAKSKTGFQNQCKSCKAQTTTHTIERQMSVVSINQSTMYKILKHTSSYDELQSISMKIIQKSQSDDTINTLLNVCKETHPDRYKDFAWFLIDTLCFSDTQDTKDTTQDTKDTQDTKPPKPYSIIITKIDDETVKTRIPKDEAQRAEYFNQSKQYIEQYRNDPNMKQIGEDYESDDEYKILTVRSGDKWCIKRVKRDLYM